MMEEASDVAACTPGVAIWSASEAEKLGGYTGFFGVLRVMSEQEMQASALLR